MDEREKPAMSRIEELLSRALLIPDRPAPPRDIVDRYPDVEVDEYDDEEYDDEEYDEEQE